MFLVRSKTIKTLILFQPRQHSTATAIATSLEAHSPPFKYLPGFPIPDPKHDETIIAVPRSKSGKSIAAKERKSGRVPSILFEQENGQEGGNKRLISVQRNQIKKLLNHLSYPFLLSRLFNVELRDESGNIIEKVRAIPRLLHLDPSTDAILNVTFMEAPSKAILKVDVPLVFRGDDACPGLRKGAYLNTIKRTVKYLCPADIIPPYIDVDLSELDIGQKIVAKDLKVHPALKLLIPPDFPVCNIFGSRGAESKKSK